MAIEKELLDQLLAGRDPGEVFAKDELLDDLKKALSERILNAELDEHLGEEREAAGGAANRRNGVSKKSVLTGTSKMTLSIPRDRGGASETWPAPSSLVANSSRASGRTMTTTLSRVHDQTVCTSHAVAIGCPCSQAESLFADAVDLKPGHQNSHD